MANSVNIIRGSDRSIVLSITKKPPCDGECGDPFDLSGASQIKARFQKDDGSVLEVSQTGGAINVLSPIAGKIKISLSDADTSSLNIGESQSFEVEIQIGTITSLTQLTGVLNVVERLFV